MSHHRLSTIVFTFLSVLAYFITPSASAASTDHFVTTWKTDNVGTSGDTSITIPTSGTGYAYQVDWNNDGDFLDPDEATINNGSITHNFGSAGTYTIRIKGTFSRIYFNNGGDKEKITSLDQWGTGQWTSMKKSFFGALNLQVQASDAPVLSQVESLSYMFRGAEKANPNTSIWNTSAITDMSYMFYGAILAKPQTENPSLTPTLTSGIRLRLLQ